MTLDELKALQVRLKLGDTHVVYLDETGFRIAHTDAERADPDFDLETCPVHTWLLAQRQKPEGVGVYMMEHESNQMPGLTASCMHILPLKI